MWRIILLSTVQSLFLAGGQVFLKFATRRVEGVSFTWTFAREQLTNWWWLATGGCMVVATVLWLYIIKHFNFSVAYPMISISYVFGMLAAIFIFHESVPVTRWVGVALIMGGVILIAR
jgi:undecaprenyl phosphate-alpha-L-ara4N flippase subunit ArnE